MNIKTRLCAILCALFLALFLVPGALFARHDGFFFRFLGGLGDGSFTASHDGGSTEYATSSARIFALSIGWSLNRNWILHYNAEGLSASDIEKLEGGSSGYSISSRAIGASYYFLSQNVYISPELRFSSDAELDIDDEDGDVRLLYSGNGFGFTIGKEWWASANWGLGLAISYHKDSLDGDNNDGSASTSHLGILFSATYN